MTKLALITLIAFVQLSSLHAKEINLQGRWQLYIDYNKEYGIHTIPQTSFDDAIVLPSTLDQAKKGTQNNDHTQTLHLTRNYNFKGQAWYRKEIIIPNDWDHRYFQLFLERTRATHVWIDNNYISSCYTLSAPQLYDLPPLSAGKHTITILVDNGDSIVGLPASIHSSHMWSDDTQTNWNGIVGAIKLVVNNSSHMVSIKSFPQVESKSVHLQIAITNNEKAYLGHLIIKEGTTLRSSTAVTIEQGTHLYEVNDTLQHAQLWSEFNPQALYPLTIELKNENTSLDAKEITVGLRSFKVAGKHFKINDEITFLRGKHDACVFPLTGYAPMDVASWLKYFDILKSYGFNHVRFHSWCPPEAAFEAADQKGFYLQPELPIWGNIAATLNDTTNNYLLHEAKCILDAYGNHPSFVLFSNGNELWGSIDGMRLITDSLRRYDCRPLYTFGSNYHLGWDGTQDGEDYTVTCRVGGENDAQFAPHVRASFSFADAIDGGYLNARYPNTEMDFSQGSKRTHLPVVAHETGQYQMYPDFRELDKYTGVLRPDNLLFFKNKLEQKHGEDKVKTFFQASAALSRICYKADIEMELRTPNMAGFQLLDLLDYPGQGTAIIGMLNAFMESKGIITPQEFRSFCSPIVPLLRTPKFVWSNNEHFIASVDLANYSSNSLMSTVLTWKLMNKQHVIQRGTLPVNVLQGQVLNVGALNITLSNIKEPQQLQLELTVNGVSNNYAIWVYPEVKQIGIPSNVRLFTRMNKELIDYLQSGGRAILMPDTACYASQTVGGLFTPDYWNYAMFKTISENAKKPISPGTLGLLIQNTHPALAQFPTEFHSNWQWWGIAKTSHPLIMDSLKTKITPIVESIDNIERDHKLALIFECGVGNGKLLVCMANLKDHQELLECKQLYKSLVDYVASKQFQPSDQLTQKQINGLFNVE